MELTEKVYIATKKLPKEEIYSLTNQIRRAAVSIPSNIAEGHSRRSKKEFVQFLSIALGSKAELETQMLLCVNIGYLCETDISDIMLLLQKIGKMLFAFIHKLGDKV